MPEAPDSTKCQNVRFNRIIASVLRSTVSALEWRPRTVSRFYRGAVRRDAGNSRFPMNEQSAPPISLASSATDHSFPKAYHLLRPSEFRRVYDNGSRISGSLFTSFLLQREERSNPRIGFTLPRALGKAVRRNRMRRRLREAIRLEFHRVPARWDIVINPRRTLEDASWELIQKEVRKLVTRCGG